MECGARGITVLEPSNRNIFCGKRLLWILVTIGRQTVVEIITLSNVKYEFVMFYLNCKLQWFSAVYLECNYLKEMYRINDDFLRISHDI